MTLVGGSSQGSLCDTGSVVQVSLCDTGNGQGSAKAVSVTARAKENGDT